MGSPELANVLVVDDEESIRNLLSMVVTRAGGQPFPAANCEGAISVLASRAFACAVVDKNLPDGSGIQLLARIAEKSPDTQVLIVTGYANMESAVEALRLGAFDYITKPFDVGGVTHRIKLALERHQLRIDLARAMGELRHANARLAESREEVKRAYLETTLRLARVAEYRDEKVHAHVTRISRYSAILARAVQATEEFIDGIVYASPLHDVGKIAVPGEILFKPGPLTPGERAQVNEHVAAGARILEGAAADVMVLAHEIVETHHERWDGSGYPRGLRGDDIPLAGRIVAIADAFDAVSTDRPYRRALPFDHAVEEIRRGAGTMYDPTLVDAFIERMEQFRAVYDELGR